MECQLCEKYWRAERVEEKKPIGNNKFIVIINRVCPVKEAIVTETDESCDQFSPTMRFWCQDSHYWITVAACQNRQTKEVCTCTLGNLAASIELKKTESIKKKLVIRKPTVKKQLVIRKPKKQLVIRRKP